MPLWMAMTLLFLCPFTEGLNKRKLKLTQACPKGWEMASGTIYDSWPKPGSTECIQYSGCQWAGQFSNLNGGQEPCCCKNGAQWLDGGNGQFACRFPQSLVKEMKVTATWNKDSILLGKTIKIMISGNKRKKVVANVIDLCSDQDCDGCCKRNSSNKRYKLIDLEAQVACELLGLDYTDPEFDVNSLSTPQNKRPGARRYTLPLCYKVIGSVDSI